MAQPDFVDSRVARRIRRSAQSIDEEHSQMRKSQKCFSCPLLNQLRRNHGQGRERLSLAMDVDSAERDQRLASPALRDDCRAACLTPSLHHTHDGKRLRREWLPQELRDERRRYIVKPVQRREGLKNPLTEFGGPCT